jgi:hypothetical protein
LSTKTVGEIIAGRVWPGLESIALIADALGLQVHLVPIEGGGDGGRDPG